MAVEVEMNTPLAEALGNAIKPKLVEVGWATEGENDSPLSEYIVLMLVNGKTQDEIAAELASDLLGLGADDPGVRDFAQWLFYQIESINNQIQNGANQNPSVAQEPQPEPFGGQNGGQDQDQDQDQDEDMDMAMATDSTQLNAPTGPKSMRNGDARGGPRGGKRMLGQMNRAMDRSHDSVLHRVRGGSGNERINAHGRTPPTGPRGGRMNNRAMNNRANNIAHGMASQFATGPMPGADMGMMMSAGAPGQGGNIFELLQQQNQMMLALSQQLAASQNDSGPGTNGRGRGRGRGKSLFERTQRGNTLGRGGGHHGNGHHPQQQQGSAMTPNGAGADGEDVDMSQPREAPNPELTVCKYNLRCANNQCKFAHQSPAAPPNTTVDVNDVCPYGAACKNFKCVGRHPSPANKRTHQSEQECRFYPNCTNPACPFKHPEQPPCRNGGDCKVEGCQFAHVTTMCRFRPCTNRYCAFKHEDGQRGTFQDKVWTANGAKDHVSERKFVDQNGNEELVVPGAEGGDSGAMDEGGA